MYDTKGNVLQQIDAYGKTNVFTYDPDFGNLLTSTDPLGNLTTRTYDTNGKLLSVTLPYPNGADPLKYRTTYTYDDGGRLLTTTLSTGGVLETVYDGTSKLPKSEKVGATTIWSALYNANAQMYSESEVFGATAYSNFSAQGDSQTMTPPIGQAVTSAFDPNGQLTSLTSYNINGTAISSTVDYDALGRETAADYGNGITVAYSHTANLDWTSVDAPTVGHMERSMDEQNRLAGWETVNGATPGFAYDDNGRLRYETNSIGVVTAYTYDLVGRVTQVNNLTTTASSRSVYDDAGQRIQEINAFSATNYFTYWPAGSLKTMTDTTTTNVWQYSDSASGCATCGNGVTVTDPLGRVSEDVRTPYGLPSQIIRRASAGATGANAATNSTTYLANLVSPDQEAEEYPATITDEGGRVRSFGYSVYGQLVWASDLGGNKWTNHYSATSGALLSIASPTGATLSYGYDALDNLKNITFADGGKLTNFYDSANPVNGIRLPTALHLTNFFDSAGRLQTRQLKNGSTVLESATFNYNLNDAVTTVSDATGNSTHSYDSAGRLKSIAYPTTASVAYERDLLDRITAITNKASSGGTAYVTRYKYDSLGRITNIVDQWSGNTYLEYDRVGRRTKRTLPNSVVSEWLYNWKDQVTNITHKIGGTTLASAAYERASGGEPTKITREDGTYVVLQYDAALRLTNEVYYTSGGSATATNGYSYDANGSRTKLKAGGTDHNCTITSGYRMTELRRASDNVLLETYGYDSGGRVTSIARTGLNSSVTYNWADQLASIAGTTYHYDGIGRRVKTTGGAERRFLIGGTPETDLESTHLVADSGNAIKQMYAFLGDQPLMRSDTNATNRIYFLEDGMGSVIGLAPHGSPGTANTSRIFYDGFGNVRGTAGPTPTSPTGTGGDFRFHGLWLEDVSGLYHARARDYDPKTGRFLSRDPMDGDLREAESMHPYVVANNNPLIYSDPSGEFSIIDLSAASSIDKTLQAMKQSAIQELKNQALDTIRDIVISEFRNAFLSMFPNFDILTSLKKGCGFESVFQSITCDHVESFPNGISLYPGVREDGTPVDNGLTCDSRSELSRLWPPRRGVRRPDLIIGSPPAGSPTGFTHSGGGWVYPKTLTVVEMKLRPGTIVRDYIQNIRGRRGQFEAMVNYSAKHTYTHTMVLVTLTPNSHVYRQLQTELGGKALKKGVFCLLVTNTNKHRRR